MLQLTRVIETPSRFDRAYLQGRYPGYAILGARAGWFYPIVPTKTVVVAGTWSGLTKAVYQHLSANKLVVPVNLNESMQDWWCREVDRSNCAEPVDPLAVARAVSLQSRAWRFLRTAVSWVLSSQSFVEQEEAERRAAICAECPLNMDIKCGGGCGFVGMLNTAMKLFASKSTTRDQALQSCGICGCALKVSVHIPLEVMNYPELVGEWEKANPLCWHRPQ